jgi:hypothetical protein
MTMVYNTGSYDLEIGQKIKQKENVLASVSGFIICHTVTCDYVREDKKSDFPVLRQRISDYELSRKTVPRDYTCYCNKFAISEFSLMFSL